MKTNMMMTENRMFYCPGTCFVDGVSDLKTARLPSALDNICVFVQQIIYIALTLSQ